MNRRIFLKRAALVAGAAVLAPKALFAKPVSEFKYKVPCGHSLIAVEDFYIGDFAVSDNCWLRHPKSMDEDIIGLTLRSIKKGERILYDPEGKVGDIHTHNTVFEVTDNLQPSPIIKDKDGFNLNPLRGVFVDIQERNK